MIRALENSLRRLGTDYVDLYLIHWPSNQAPLGKTIQALNELVRRGLTRYIGVSNFNLDQLRKAQGLSEVPIATNQVPYSLLERSYVRNGVLAHCQQEGILLTPYSPVKGGMLHHPRVRQVAQKYGGTGGVALADPPARGDHDSHVLFHPAPARKPGGLGFG